ncbi:hypothetical protein LCGC14_2249000, partial [marine sediment metagenome]
MIMTATANTGHRPEPLRIRRTDPVARFNLRVAPAERARVAQELGCALPEAIGQGAVQDACATWCLGPDEWLIHVAEAQAAALVAASA